MTNAYRAVPGTDEVADECRRIQSHWTTAEQLRRKTLADTKQCELLLQLAGILSTPSPSANEVDPSTAGRPIRLFVTPNTGETRSLAAC